MINLETLRSRTFFVALLFAIVLFASTQITELVLLRSSSDTILELKSIWSIAALLILFSASIGGAVFIALRQNTSRLQWVVEHLNEGLLFFGADAKVVFANALARQIIEASGSDTCRIPEALFNTLNLSSSSPTPVFHETKINGIKRHFLVSGVDVKEEHLGESFIRLLYRNLDTSPIRRKMFIFKDVTFLRESEEAKVNFIGTLSHEIKTPVTSLAMAVAMLERTGYDAELVRIANADVARLRTLLEDLLHVSKLKIVHNPNNLQLHHANLSALFHQALKAAELSAKERGIHLVAPVRTPAKITANIDPTKISWAATTLLADAIRQTPTKGTINVIYGFDSGQAFFSIDYERRQVVLEPTRHAIVKDIIESHGGRFSSQNGLDTRGTFQFMIQAMQETQRGNATDEANIAG
jgi:signal transduction histidine kinase